MVQISMLVHVAIKTKQVKFRFLTKNSNMINCLKFGEKAI